ncbi:MAG: DUF4835 family protein [Saprospiraceae bacterium]|nr:DUF4835 family protein [Saprospiraceae bacterium]
MTQSSIKSPTNDAAFFKDMEKRLSDFINTTRWSDDEFQNHEKIRGSVQLTITEEVNPTLFKAEIVWQTERPVYNSIYSSPIMNLIDKSVSFYFQPSYSHYEDFQHFL